MDEQTSMSSWMANTASWASTSGSSSLAFLSAMAARALPMFPKQTVATSSRWVITHIFAMFSHTPLLQCNEMIVRNGHLTVLLEYLIALLYVAERTIRVIEYYIIKYGSINT